MRRALGFGVSLWATGMVLSGMAALLLLSKAMDAIESRKVKPPRRTRMAPLRTDVAMPMKWGVA